jgi:cytoskeletal protein CcmA (bactofilin family)
MTTTIGPSVLITGEIVSEDDLTIDGQVLGPISVRNATLTIGEQAQLDGDLRAARIAVHGTVHGVVAATERIELHATANVTGSLSANHVVIADGATFNGRIDMDRRTIAAKVAQYKAEGLRAKAEGAKAEGAKAEAAVR